VYRFSARRAEKRYTTKIGTYQSDQRRQRRGFLTQNDATAYVLKQTKEVTHNRYRLRATLHRTRKIYRYQTISIALPNAF
jgi:hypothetical protein